MSDFYKKKSCKKKEFITALVADQNGEIFELEGYAAVGMAGSQFIPLTMDNTIEMPYGSELMFLPARVPILYNIKANTLESIWENPYSSHEKIFPVSGFISPGHTLSYICAYQEDKKADFLPLFSYGAVGWKDGSFRCASILVDKEKRQDLRLMPQDKIIKGVERKRQTMPNNRLTRHLEKCALEYGCPAAKNFFIGRYEAPLPTSQKCNARCLGCISFQISGNISHCQDRISFTPYPEEIVEIALDHIKKVENPVVSFGQGCEGDPLLAFKAIEPAIRKIRSKTDKGTINMNTNASKPDVLKKLFDAGLDSIRVSLNSARHDCYKTYFRPVSYTFEDVKKSIDLANKENKFISLNYFTCPGFTDCSKEFEALVAFIKKHPVNFIQWRNLNFDPLRYHKIMNKVADNSNPLGVKTILSGLKKIFPNISYGYFNPPKEKF